MELLIAIFNPQRLEIENDLTSHLREHSGITCFSFHNFDFQKFPDLQPDLIFFILDSCCLSIDKSFVEQFNLRFNLVPVIGIFNSSKICPECTMLQKVVWSFIPYPFKKQDVFLAIKWFNLNKEKFIESSLKKHVLFDLYKGDSKASVEIKKRILKIAEYDVTVLINGETGTGKELCAKMIHFMSNRSKNNFVPLNCGAVPHDLFENELFGHKKGAYTNADSSESGLIAEADNGTLFLDEIESLPELMQVKLLRFLEDKKYKPLGQSNYISSNVRVIAAAKENLWAMVKKNQFREDLFFRLNILNLTLPPLRERKEDLPLLVDFFIKRYCNMYSKSVQGIKPTAMLSMFHHNWEGNIRELQNAVQEAVIMNVSGWIDEDDFRFADKKLSRMNLVSSFKTSKKIVISDFEKAYLNNVLEMFKGNLTQSAKFAGKDRRAFCRMLKKYNINPSMFKN